MHGTDASVHEPGEDREVVAAPRSAGPAPDPVVTDVGPDPVAPGDDADLAGVEADLDTVDAALEALDADELDAAEALVASLTDEGGEHAADATEETLAASLTDDTEPPSAPAAPTG